MRAKAFSSVGTRDGNYVYFGNFPQSVKSDDVSIVSSKNSDGYYLGSDGELYELIIATPYGDNYMYSSGAPIVETALVYFKVEPLKWRILSETDGVALVVCDQIIAGSRFSEMSNNYKESEVRSYLNDVFLNKAFTEQESAFIKTTLVDNSIATTGDDPNYYLSEDTLDKIFLLSYADITNPLYGYDDYLNAFDTARQVKTTDYARASGTYMNTSNHYGCGTWWTRSPVGEFDYIIKSAYADGVIYWMTSYMTGYGILPAMQIQID
jgi:hypothetical protein